MLVKWIEFCLYSFVFNQDLKQRKWINSTPPRHWQIWRRGFSSSKSESQQSLQIGSCSELSIDYFTFSCYIIVLPPWLFLNDCSESDGGADGTGTWKSGFIIILGFGQDWQTGNFSYSSRFGLDLMTPGDLYSSLLLFTFWLLLTFALRLADSFKLRLADSFTITIFLPKAFPKSGMNFCCCT